jgi:hypothetical protein
MLQHLDEINLHGLRNKLRSLVQQFVEIGRLEGIHAEIGERRALAANSFKPSLLGIVHRRPFLASLNPARAARFRRFHRVTWNPRAAASVGP